MPDPTHAELMVAKLQALELQCAGMQSITVDGELISLSKIRDDLEYYEAKVAREQGTRPVSFGIDLSGGG